MIKPTKQENKKNKNTIKVKKEPLKPELKSKMKSKDKTKPAKPIEVNNRKITEFLLLDQDRGKTSTFSKTQNLVVKPAKQESKTQLSSNTLSDYRRGGGGKQVYEKSNSNGRSHSTYQGVCKAECDWTNVTR